MTVGVFFGRFLPLQRGQLKAILRAHALCERLYVVVREDERDLTACQEARLPFISGQLRQRWLTEELQGLGIHCVVMNERGLPNESMALWSDAFSAQLRKAVPDPIELVFAEDEHSQLLQWTAEASTLPVSCLSLLHGASLSASYEKEAMLLREPVKHWDVLAVAARPFFTKKVLVTGPESCGKTTLTRKLATLYATSWSEEVGRTYQEQVLDGKGHLFTEDDFNRIVHLQYERDLHTLKDAQKVCFFDTDAVVTAFFSHKMLGKLASRIESFISKEQYDVVILLKPTVPWVADGIRELGEAKMRQSAFDELYALYLHYGFRPEQLVVIDSADYLARLDASIAVVDSLLWGQ